MFRELVDILISFIRSRMFILCVIFTLMFSILIARVFQLQIIDAEYYQEFYVQKAERDIYTSATRGNIYDRNGKLLAYNKLAYAVTITDTLDDSDDKNAILNDIIFRTIQIIEENGDSLINDFPIHLNKDGEFKFSSDLTEFGILGALRDLYGKSTIEELDSKNETLSNSSAAQVFAFLRNDRYKVDEKYTDRQALKIIKVRYKLSQNNYQKYIPAKIASNISEETMAAIYENQAILTGVSITEETIRVYNDSTYFAHIIGYTGTVSDEQMEELNGDIDKDDDLHLYQSTDIVGKSGIEQEMESHLQGVKGKKTVFANSTGQILDILEETDSVAGNDIYLTIDSKLQIATYNILEQKLAGILISKIVNRDVTDDERVDSDDIPIGIKEVYYQLINNNVIDLSHFSGKKASANEQYIYEKFKSKQSQVLSWMESEMNSSSADKLKNLSEEKNTYLSYAYDKLKSASVGIVLTSDIDTEDEIFQKWSKEKISLREYLLYAISQNWIDTSKLNISEKYANTEMIYQAIIEYLKTSLKKDTDFSKKIYYYMIQDETITGNEICMALFDQNIIKMNQKAYNKLSSGKASYAFDFMVEQIRLINITPAQLALDPCSGSCIVTDTDTGDVLALVTYPSYDNNKLSGTVDAEYWESLTADLSTPLLNRATMTRTAPGSTFKMLTAIAGLEEGVITTTEAIKDEGEYEQVTPHPKCWKYPQNHGFVDVSDALSVSCNYFFYEVGYRLGTMENGKFNTEYGLERLEEYATAFGLTDYSGVQLAEYEPIFSTISPVHTAIGQGSNSFANVQLVRYVNTVANSGSNYKLTLLDKINDCEGNQIVNYKPVLDNTVDVAESTWDAVHKGMRLVITEGTGKTIFENCDISVAGKSGTAQENKKRSSHSLFVAYAPYDNPEISLSVLIPYGESSGYTGEVIRDVLKYYYKQTKLKDILNGTASVPTSGITGD